MAGSWTPGGGSSMGTMDTLPPADGLPDWLRRMGWPEAAALLEHGPASDPVAAALERALLELWQARCQGVELAHFRVLARPVWVLCSGGEP